MRLGLTALHNPQSLELGDGSGSSHVVPQAYANDSVPKPFFGFQMPTVPGVQARCKAPKSSPQGVDRKLVT